jgi:hypothetical protein
MITRLQFKELALVAYFTEACEPATNNAAQDFQAIQH